MTTIEDGLARDDVNHVMDTFPIVKRRDVRHCSDYRTRVKVLEIYDRLVQRSAGTVHHGNGLWG